MSEWKTIESAPSDGGCIVWCETDDGGEMRILDRDRAGNWIYDGQPTFKHGFYIEPTHRLPLPERPA